jgi:hypothetical protein
MAQYLFLFLTLLSFISKANEGIDPDTLVKIPKGFKSATTLSLNDTLTSIDRNNLFTEKKLLRNKKIISDEIVKIFIKEQTLIIGPDTLFFIPEKNAWKLAKQLIAGDCLYSAKFGKIAIDAITIIKQSSQLHQLSISNPHVLLISELEIAIHNFILFPTLVWTIGEGLSIAGWETALTFTGLALSQLLYNKIKLPGEGDGWKKLKGNQGWIDSEGRIWHKDKKHKDHWDVSDRKGNKILEVDFNGKKIWPGGPKNKNKK